MKLEVLIGVDNEEPRLATGSCSRTLLESLGYDPTYFREQGHLITSWVWKRTHDGYKGEPQPEPPKKRQPSAKAQDALARKWDAWSK